MYFPDSMGVRIIAEPGRFFVTSAFTLAVNIIAKRVMARDEVTEGQYTSNTIAKLINKKAQLNQSYCFVLHLYFKIKVQYPVHAMMSRIMCCGQVQLQKKNF